MFVVNKPFGNKGWISFCIQKFRVTQLWNWGV